MNNTIVGVDLAKNVIQVCIVKNNGVVSNEEVIPEQFMLWLINTKPVTIVFEACGMSNYWKQEALKHGHDAKLVSARLVAMIRQNQKTDKNDALAVAQASQLTDVNFINGKNVKQQEMQSILRMRELAVKQKVAIQQQIAALLLEFNIRVSVKQGGLSGVVQAVLEDADNGFAFPFRQALEATWQSYLSLVDHIKISEIALEGILKEHPDCQKLLALEGVGVINAVNLYITIGCSDSGVFKSGRDVAACIGLTPVQHSSGGKVKIGAISQRSRSPSVRSCLITGAMSMVNQMGKREPKTKKERWLKQLIERRGKLCAAIALANKTVRTAFALLTQGTEYKAQPLMA
jgi:transposase